MNKNDILYLIATILILGVLVSVIITQINIEPNTCIIETRSEIIIGRSCWQNRAGCINYSKDGIDYTLCGDFKVHTKK
jgi:hypothetical protein